MHIGILQHKRLFPSVNGYNLQLTLQFSELQWKKTEVKFESRGDWRKGLFIMGETEPTEQREQSNACSRRCSSRCCSCTF